MNYKAVINYLGHILRIEGLLMLPAVVIAIFLKETASIHSFIAVAVFLVVCGTLLVAIKKSGKPTSAREGFITVALGWIFISLFGALPFVFSGCIPNFIDAFFETVSGFTTTGASILKEVEGLPYSILYWRSFTNWIGGMGVLVFILAIVPLSRGGSGETFQLLKAESPGPTVGKLTPTISKTARILYAIYIGMTLVEFILLICGGMPVFDSLTTSFATAGTGGFSVRNAGIAAYESGYLQFVIAVFMMLFGVNFNIFYLILLGKFKQAFKNEEVRVYLGLMLASTLAFFISIYKTYSSVFKALLDSYFQASSIMTTTGFATADFDKWPEFARALILILMLFGACAGSTGGGFKISRLIILVKSGFCELKYIVRPREVKPVHIDGKTVDGAVIRNTSAYLVVYVLVTIVSLLGVSLNGFDMVTSSSAVISCINNIGPGLNLVGPTVNYSFLSGVSKIILSFDMLIGRLELFPILMLFYPAGWARK